MEVHHHPDLHHKRKKFREYFLEFLMIFLAVTMGFFAESLREKMSDHSKEKEYMRSLTEDLGLDTTALRSNIEAWQYIIANIDSIRKYLEPPIDKIDPGSCYKYAAALYSFTEFNYSDRTIEQLRNSGNFRIIRNDKIADSLISYDNIIRNQVRNQEAFARNEFSAILSMEGDLFNSGDIQKMQTRSLDSIVLKDLSIQRNPVLISRFFNELFKYRWIISVNKNVNISLKSYAASLISMIKKEYHLE
jgi:hypothetical protein